jgi:hypothetical protein
MRGPTLTEMMGRRISMSGKHTRQRLLNAACAGWLLGTAALAWSPAVWGQGASPALQAQESQPPKIDRSLPGSRKGVLTKAKDGVVWIDGRKYVLASSALLEKVDGGSMLVNYLNFAGMDFEVEYWLGPKPDPQITQMIVKFHGG